MNGFVGLIPLLFVRILILKLLSRAAGQRAAYFAPMPAIHKMFYYLYQFSQLLLVLLPFYYSIKWSTIVTYIGSILWGIGLLIVFLSVSNFSKPDASGLNTNGIYRFSRNPMYVGYYIYYSGLALLMHSWLYTLALTLFMWTSHFIILAEEAWCEATFGEKYLRYRSEVRRYL